MFYIWLTFIPSILIGVLTYIFDKKSRKVFVIIFISLIFIFFIFSYSCRDFCLLPITQIFIFFIYKFKLTIQMLMQK